jgi:MFS family permease
VEDLSRVADRLLLLAPDVEPPAGFESRVLAAVGSAAVAVGGDAREAGRRRRVRDGHRGRRPWALVGLVASVAAAAAVGGGIVTDALRPSPEPSVLRTGLAVSASGRTSCRVVVSGTRPASVLVSMDGYPGTDTEFRVEMQTAGGTAIALGPMAVASGHGLLVGSLDVDADTLASMTMFGRDGQIVYQATLSDAAPTTP